jgi:hypothetical protein
VAHDEAEDLVGLPLIREDRPLLASDSLQPFARHDELRADRNAGKKAVELAQEHHVVRAEPLKELLEMGPVFCSR